MYKGMSRQSGATRYLESAGASATGLATSGVASRAGVASRSDEMSIIAGVPVASNGNGARGTKELGARRKEAYG